MKKRLISILLCAAVTCGIFAGCGSENQGKEENKVDKEQKKEIIMGGPQMFMDYINFLPDVMKEKGYDVKIQVFDDVVTPNTALAEGSIDVNFYQHKPYLDAYNKSNGTDLVACEPYIMASYDAIVSKKYTSLDQLPDGAKVAICDDASNMSSNLHTLEYLGLIELNDIPEGSYYTLFDIAKNPKNLEFVEVALNTQYTVLDDVDIAVVFYSNNSAKKYQCNIVEILDEDPTVAFPVIVAVDGKNKDEQWVKDVMEAMTGEEMKAKIEELNTPHKVWRTLFE